MRFDRTNTKTGRTWFLWAMGLLLWASGVLCGAVVMLPIWRDEPRTKPTAMCDCGFRDHYIDPALDKPPEPSLGWRCAHCNHQRPGHEPDCVVTAKLGPFDRSCLCD